MQFGRGVMQLEDFIEIAANGIDMVSDISLQLAICEAL